MQPRAAPGGIRSGSGSGRRCSRPSTAGCSSTTGSRRRSSGAIYRVGLALLDLDEPTRVLRRTADWVLAPHEPYERQGDVPNALFPCGLIHDATRASCGCTTARPTRRSASRRAQFDDVLDAVLGATTVNR